MSLYCETIYDVNRWTHILFTKNFFVIAHIKDLRGSYFDFESYIWTVMSRHHGGPPQWLP